ncbi:hypothetical protein MMC20_006736 [Loxospora ochrophaea]|nr:hypothetical protein [Loxospora ochrophaea]
MSVGGSSSLAPSYVGHVASTKDALLLFEACLNGQVSHVPRRPHDRERSQLIRSGSVFIYEENASGIKRWTDGVPWSPSRILGNFLVYRELSKPFPPGEKKRATKRNKRPSRPGEPYPRPNNGEGPSSANGSAGLSPTSPTTPTGRSDALFDRETERALIGSLVDSYGFKESGLVKKTMSVNVHGVHHHLVSYYKLDDVMEGRLKSPSKDRNLMSLNPRGELMHRQNFRSPLDEQEDATQEQMGQMQISYGLYANNYDPNRHSSLTGQGPHGHPMPLQYYPNMPFSTGPQLHPSLTTYASLPSTQAFFSSSHSLPPAVMPKQEDYSGYGHYDSQYDNITTPGPPSQPQRMTTLNYPQQSPQVIIPRPNGTQSSPNPLQDGRTADQSAWQRGSGSGFYAPTAPVPTSMTEGGSVYQNSPYQNGNQWSLAPNSQRPQQIRARAPDLESFGSGGDQSWLGYDGRQQHVYQGSSGPPPQ